MSIDGLTIMINVNRKKQKNTIKQSVMCTGTKQPCCCLAVAATAQGAAWGECPGSAAWGKDGGQGHKPGSSFTRSPLVRSLLATLDFSYQDAGFGRSSTPFEYGTCGVCSWTEAGQGPARKWASGH